MYVEVHHIIPQCAGGNNSTDNLVVFTAAEHFIAHLLLVKIHENSPLYYKMLCAAHMMANNKSKHNNKQYSQLRAKFAKARTGATHSVETKLKLCAARKQRITTDETKLKMSNARKGKPKSDETKFKISSASKGRTTTNETKLKISTANKGKTRSDETKYKMGTAHKGKTHSEESKLKMRGRILSDEIKNKISETRKNRLPIICPHCGKEGAVSGMKRYHFDNCKQQF